MRIGFIGAGIVAQTIAKHVLPFGHQVVFHLFFASNMTTIIYRTAYNLESTSTTQLTRRRT
jgi:3-hydroxyisobutyrate dehydrogenase-like beta-hydroxyacid dehydrogenase